MNEKDKVVDPADFFESAVVDLHDAWTRICWGVGSLEHEKHAMMASAISDALAQMASATPEKIESAHAFQLKASGSSH